MSRGSMPFLTIAFPVFDPIAIAIGPIATAIGSNTGKAMARKGIKPLYAERLRR